eukprot:115795-Ditylum_brightwellii.AAC.1
MAKDEGSKLSIMAEMSFAVTAPFVAQDFAIMLSMPLRQWARGPMCGTIIVWGAQASSNGQLKPITPNKGGGIRTYEGATHGSAQGIMGTNKGMRVDFPEISGGTDCNMENKVMLPGMARTVLCKELSRCCQYLCEADWCVMGK